MTSIAGGIPIRYDAETHTYRLEYEWWDEHSVTTAIVMAVAAITNTPTTEIEPLGTTLDPDALNHLYTPSGCDQRHQEDGHTTFRLHDCDVTVYANGDIDIRPPDEVDDASLPATNH